MFPGSCLDAETEWLWALSLVQLTVTLNCMGAMPRTLHQASNWLFWFIPKHLGFATVPIPQIQTSSSEKGKSAFLKCLTGIYATLAPVFCEKTLPRPPDQTLLTTPAAPAPRASPAPGLPGAPAPSVFCVGQPISLSFVWSRLEPWGYRTFCLLGLHQGGVERSERKETSVRHFLWPLVKEPHQTAVCPERCRRPWCSGSVPCPRSVTWSHGIAGFVVTVLTWQA